MPPIQNTLAVPETVLSPLHPVIGNQKFSWVSELRHLFSRRFSNILWWPLFKFRQQRFTYTTVFQSCRPLPGFIDLWKTILKGSFAYNSLFLGVSPFFYASKTAIVDITTLTLFFGDEFLDGLTITAGKDETARLFLQNPEIFYLKKRVEYSKITLYYVFELQQYFPAVMTRVNPKYGVTYSRFYGFLKEFVEILNALLNKQDFALANKSADKISDTWNTCFNSFLHDLRSCTEAGKLANPVEILDFHEIKTAYMQTKLLELRCILLNSEEKMMSIQTPGWLDIMRVIQIYDDIQDVVLDDGCQDNLVLSVAAHYFPHEWEWFCTQKSKISSNARVLLSIHMPCTMEFCQRLAAKKISAMNWEQQKIMHYLLLRVPYSLYENDKDSLIDQPGFLIAFYTNIKDRMRHLPEETIKCFVIDTCVLIPDTRKKLLKKIKLGDVYQLRFNLYTVNEKMKSRIFDRIVGS